jgi:hypothetical protein
MSETQTQTKRDLLPATMLFRAMDKQVIQSMETGQPLEYERGDATVRVSFEVVKR